jgi:hypothetical protein
MTSQEFVKAVKLQTSDAAVNGTVKMLEKPAGRKPAERLVFLSNWYNKLNPDNQQMLKEVLREAAEMAVFEFFCVLDGVAVIEDGTDKGALELHYVKGKGKKQLNDPRHEELHNLFNSLCRNADQGPTQSSDVNPYESDTAKILKSKLKSGDELDIHHVPDKYSSIKTIENYDSNNASAIVLPKPEHRRVPHSFAFCANEWEYSSLALSISIQSHSSQKKLE